MAKRTNKKKTGSAISWLKLPEIPGNIARPLLIALIFMNAGMAYLAATRAATAYTVRFVYFCPASPSTCSTARNTSIVDGYGNSVHSWYTTKVGKSFIKTTSYTLTGQHTASYYYTHATNGLPTGSGYDVSHTYYNLYNELTARGWITSYTKFVVVLGFHSMNHCGVGGGLLAIADPQQGCGSIQPSVISHELGHTFLSSSNSDHTTSCDSNGTTCNFMHTPLACNGKTIGYCSMYSSQKTTISGRPWFNN